MARQPAPIRAQRRRPSPWPTRSGHRLVNRPLHGLPGPLFVVIALDSVRNLVRLFQPFLEDLARLLGFEMDEWHGPVVDRLVELAVDVIVVEADSGRVDARVGVVYAIQSSPVDGAQTHRAGLATGVHLAALQVEGAELAAGRADGDHLGMGG